VERHSLAYALDVRAARTGLRPMPFGKGIQYERLAWQALHRARQGARKRRDTSLNARDLLLGCWRGGRAAAAALEGMAVGRGGAVVRVARRSMGRGGAARACRARRRPGEQWSNARGDGKAAAGCRWFRRRTWRRRCWRCPSQVQRVLTEAGLDPQACLKALREIHPVVQAESEWHESGGDW